MNSTQGQANVNQLKEIHNIPQRQYQNTSLIQSLKQQPNFLIERYNEKMKIENPTRPARAGGVYIPPHKLRAMQEQIMQKQAGGIEHQKMMWQLLRKSINGIVNKVNISNIQNIVIQLFNENILRGKGLLAKSIIKAQMASPNFTHVYAALIAVINTKLPEIGNLILKRVMIQFRRAFQRNNKIVCIATTKMIAHLINQRVLGEYAGLQLLFILLNQPTQASVEIACDFMTEAGQVLSQITAAGANAIFQRFKTLLHEGQISQKAQYSIQNLFAIRKTGFKQHPGIIPQLDLVQAQDQIIHNLDFQQQLTGQQNINVFKFDPFYQKTQQQWDSIKLQILGQQNIINLKQIRNYEQQILQEQQLMQNMQQQQQIQDLTEQDLVNLRRTIYLIIQSTVNFEQCAHKLLKMNIAKGYQHQLVDMIIECCMMERIYQSFFGLLAERFCSIDDLYKELFIKAFINHYNAIFKLEVNKIRNLAKLFAHLIYRFAIDWTIFEVIVLKAQTTTAAGRMFLKILFKQISQNLGVQRLIQQFNKQQMRKYYQGLFPIDHPNNLRFAINYFTSIGLGPLTQNMRQILAMQQEIIMSRKQKQEEAKIMQQLKQQEEMLRLMEEEENMERQRLQLEKQAKQEQRKKVKQEEKRIEKQKLLKREEQEERRRKFNKREQGRYKRNQHKKRYSSRSRSSSSSSSSSSSNSSNSSDTPPNDKRQAKNTNYKQKSGRNRQRSSQNQNHNNKKGSQSHNYRNRQGNQNKIKQGRQRSRQKNDSDRKKQSRKRRRHSSSSESSQQKTNKKRQQNQPKQTKNTKKQSSSSKLKIQQQALQKKKYQKQQKSQMQQQKRKQIQKLKKITKNNDSRKKQSDSQSSGISSSSSSSHQSSSDQSGEMSNKSPKRRDKIRKSGRKSDSQQSSSSSSSSSSIDTNQLHRRKLKRQGKK